jgi:hypothetical protein
MADEGEEGKDSCAGDSGGPLGLSKSYHRLNMELDLQSLFGLLSCAVLIAETNYKLIYNIFDYD